MFDRLNIERICTEFFKKTRKVFTPAGNINLTPTEFELTTIYLGSGRVYHDKVCWTVSRCRRNERFNEFYPECFLLLLPRALYLPFSATESDSDQFWYHTSDP
jgi:hypothetical protein